LETALQALANFADLKSPYMVNHSTAVAELAAAAAHQYGLPASDVCLVRRAGYVHAIGRVGVSAGIWGKPGPLSEAEWERVRLHPYYTQRILAQPAVLAELGAVAALHQERLDGSGYHRSLPAALLSPAVRILAVANAYQAMREDRPHRPARSPELAAQELRREVIAGRLEGNAVKAVLAAAGYQASKKDPLYIAGLTERELEILRLVARGLSNRAIAQRLIVSPKTVGNHIQNIYSKIGVSTRAAATFFAMQHHLIQGAD
jgi:HD-GYP domain-containing protein (c-di-GMP phosphodiesterase class II)/DNA-binding CsgD family transcriptional regulator